MVQIEAGRDRDKNERRENVENQVPSGAVLLTKSCNGGHGSNLGI
jgi:hypothetical protein